MPAGNAAIPVTETAASASYVKEVPLPNNTVPMGPTTQHAAPAAKPLQLLAPLAGRATPRRDLVGHERRPEHEEGQREKPAYGPNGAAEAGWRRATRVGAGAIHAHVRSERHSGFTGELARHEEGGENTIAPQRAAPPGRETAVGEEQDRLEAEQKRKQRIGLVPVESRPSERQAASMDAIVEHEIQPQVGLEEREQRNADHDPADRVPRLAARHDDSHPGEGRQSHEQEAVVGHQQIPGQNGQRHPCDEQ